VTPAVSVRDLTVAYGEAPALWDVDLDLPEGVLAAVVGPNGAGKSTLLKAVLGLVPLGAGQVRVFGRPFDDVRRRVAYVPQRSAVDWDFPTDVLDVVLMGTYPRLGWLRRPGRRERELALASLDRMGMADLARRQIGELSGGQQQRVFLERALAQEADLFLLDEPLAGVDAPTEETVLRLLTDLQAEGKTVVLVHHDLETVRERFDWGVLLNVRLVSSGPVAEAMVAEAVVRAYGPRRA
jgi:manganese/zinc/iron transport system ATP- binding protein